MYSVSLKRRFTIAPPAGKAEGKFSTAADGMIAVQRVLTLRDDQLMIPSHVISDA